VVAVLPGTAGEPLDQSQHFVKLRDLAARIDRGRGE
jgi:hypothetical protein